MWTVDLLSKLTFATFTVPFLQLYGVLSRKHSSLVYRYLWVFHFIVAYTLLMFFIIIANEEISWNEKDPLKVKIFETGMYLFPY